MSLSEEQVGQIAYLARLSLSNEALKSNTKDLNSILSLAEQLAQIDTDNITPMAHPLHMTQRLREDKVAEEDQSESFQAIAPKIGKKHYLVPTVIE
ncbi:MAG TPA: Asp-tRNA(Asn)/Glu-tRNA(Gln) amidotransferase GatCAB subunit C [Gammaproteobacteria bacterium]|jgi:aspartyl-tRNA(Asn)/glutamyl-tRNA(Gln) amidotransferase subunit C|uniref:Aspartyl-tRNA(Asn) amidotransferase subunit C @ Glutamyl-tRNA(Gln) amidotransferase subunit C n=1 Tax=hydrothermal vent metagenome TaxID=652676 RepID=A0A1W1DS52_9ZZZZ|nr:Asp-tRNA(Asn)/Glu-tRNA(Gln) amidotransferase GatCAB subunit C [Gammaproteobacteria bacterium]HAP44818.1 Asp-tRNA(Asn)/Glu-tRNA(Gln) amidotransferase GatCAB subunit C [Gammaproteobacteria bacterium]HCA68327.1 Asp-tRNA(Asn)/Glu-tRNA(Gln) amidotransferase GatCAB subunit C [Gammaproteobacteria bacterium]HCE35167.1 Asp-tRNA(Asn)/Glu-tRNA(Gln) amidotransferase GatCAB subunit C [Gammaproteobacteria bacterium]HCJ78375.1 Asp-tRNA(Asn)/Glu-tRNA(Gln) amidotransferase GatCAB subunit C [Gammaproteobacter